MANRPCDLDHTITALAELPAIGGHGGMERGGEVLTHVVAFLGDDGGQLVEIDRVSSRCPWKRAVWMRSNSIRGLLGGTATVFLRR